jgi:hypothetical protein
MANVIVLIALIGATRVFFVSDTSGSWIFCVERAIKLTLFTACLFASLLLDGTFPCAFKMCQGESWFLVGHFPTGGTFTHSCTIPIGKALFIPLINSWADNVCVTPPSTVDELRTAAAGSVFPPKELHARIDDSSFSNLESYRAISPVFSYTLPPSPDNVIDAAFGVSLPGPCWPSLTVTPAVADGFYILLTPLTAGSHRLNFGGSGPGVTLDVTYNLTVGS